MWTGEQFLLCMLHFNICAFLTAGILLWLRRKSSGRARTFLAVICLFSGLAFLLRLIMYYAGFPVSSSVLPISNMIGGFLALLLLYMYPIEVIHPGWLTLKRGILMFLPGVVIWLVRIAFPTGFRELSSTGEMFGFIGEANVWFRLLFLLLFVPYTVLIYVIPHNWMKSSVTHRWIYFYSSVILCIGVCYCSFMLTGLAVASVAHLLFCLVFCILISYQELFLRIEVPAEAVPVSVPELKPVTEISPEENSADRPLWIKLNERMQEEKLWKNPNLTQDFLASLLDVSRPTLSTVIREETVQPQQQPGQSHLSPIKATPSSGRYLGVKTNLAAWAGTIMNVAADVQVSRHISVELPVLWCPWYVSDKHAVKTFTIQPEGRYWPGKPGKGHFFGVHAHVGWFSVKWNRDRYQDTGRPLLGAGISYGYLLPFSEHWAGEFTIGAGYANMKYDTYYNIDNGARIDTRTKNYWGITRVGISVVYRFNLKK